MLLYLVLSNIYHIYACGYTYTSVPFTFGECSKVNENEYLHEKSRYLRVRLLLHLSDNFSFPVEPSIFAKPLSTFLSNMHQQNHEINKLIQCLQHES